MSKAGLRAVIGNFATALYHLTGSDFGGYNYILCQTGYKLQHLFIPLSHRGKWDNCWLKCDFAGLMCDFVG
jgi:hypothetical protein